MLLWRKRLSFSLSSDNEEEKAAERYEDSIRLGAIQVSSKVRYVLGRPREVEPGGVEHAACLRERDGGEDQAEQAGLR